MVLLIVGYFPALFFAKGYYMDDYWPDYPVYVDADIGESFMLISRDKEFILEGRMKEYVITERLKDFDIRKRLKDFTLV